MLECRLSSLLKEVQTLTQCKNVKFSRPPLNSETSVHTPSKYAIGGLRHHGEWIRTFCNIQNTLKSQNVDFNVFLTTKTGQSFVKALTSRVFSLSANDIYEILLTLSLYKTKITTIESALLDELEQSLPQLHTFQLLNLPTIINQMNASFSQKLKQIVEERLQCKEGESEVFKRIVNILEPKYKRIILIDQ